MDDLAVAPDAAGRCGIMLGPFSSGDQEPRIDITPWEGSLQGDLNLDGYQDYILKVDYSEITIFFSPLEADLFETGSISFSPSGSTFLSDSLALDLNGDGMDDLAYGMAWSEGAGSCWDDGMGGIEVCPGEVRYIEGPLDEDVVDGDADASWLGVRATDSLGVWLEPGGDTNGEGAEELVINYGEQDTSGIYFVEGLASGSIELTESTAMATLDSKAGHTFDLNQAITGRDFDHDGYDDLVVFFQGDWNEDYADGHIGIYPGPFTGTIDHSDEVVTISQPEAYVWADEMPGATALDVDGDGELEVAIGVRNMDGYSYDQAEILIYPGPLAEADGRKALNLHTNDGTSDYDGFGASSIWSSDVDGDGLGDLLVRASYTDATFEDAGAHYLIWGSELSALMPR